MLGGFKLQESPPGEDEEARVTVPANPSNGAVVIVYVPVDPAVTVAVLGVATIVKSGMAILYVTVAE